MTQTLWSASALLSDGWATNVEIEIDDRGDISQVSPEVSYQQGEKLSVLIPGIGNLHSHAHQRAMAGLGERAGFCSAGSHDSFWTWRKVMYHYLARIQPHQLYHIAAQLYLEMLRHGYTCVGEFQYLHHDLDGHAYYNRAEMTLQCLQAANDVGLGFTALPVLYRYGGFGEADPLDGQKRFINDADGFVEIVNQLQKACAGNTNCSVGIAPHSLRAISQDLLRQVIGQLGEGNLAAIHIHIAEQTREVEDCLACCGKRPVEWLFDNFDVAQHWCLIHATHMTGTETAAMAKSGAVAGLCPTTEANLGDGIFNAIDYFGQNGHWAIGSDSHISVDPVEELRWLEYGQRLLSRNRNLLVSSRHKNTARNLLDRSWQGAELACGRKIGRIEAGYRADFIVLDESHPRLYSRSENSLLDSWIFSGNDNLVKHVYVGGKQVIRNGQHVNETSIQQQYQQTLDQLAE
ncbi:MAG: formimidoylglutamate deiminase [Gammaproteobacteria bacterium]|nr:formimidoylglutamate deiminase [Gammaproteobacteria bacterium]